MGVLTRYWFVEIASVTGAWQTHLMSGDCPVEKTVDGDRKFRLPPVEVPAFMTYPTILPLDTIARFLSPDGEFYGYEIEIVAKMVEYIRDPMVRSITVTEGKKDDASRGESKTQVRGSI